MIAEIKKELQHEMGLVPVTLLRDRRSSFVELYSYDSLGKTNYGTAGYLGGGYFITVKHAVVALKDDDDRQSTRKIASIKIVYKGKEIPARVIDTGDADQEVHSGDWAIIKTRDLDLPPLRVDSAFAYDFADPIFRLGNDYSKGIILSTGYVGQRTENGLVTCLTDGHPGVSGGGVLDQRGNLVGIPIGRMQGDYRFSFILPIRPEMLRKLPAYEQADPVPAGPRRRTVTPPLGLRKAGDRLGFAVVALEDRQQLGDRQQILDPLGHVQQLQRSAVLHHRRVRLDDLAEPGAVHIGHVAEVEQDFLPALLHEALHLVLQHDVAAVTQRDLARQIHDHHVANGPFRDLHASSTRLPHSASLSPARKGGPV